MIAAAIMGLYFSVVAERMNTSFQDLQAQLSVQRIERVVHQVAQLTRIRAMYAKDNAEWDDAYAYLIGEAPDFLEYNFRASDRAGGTQMVIAFDAERQMVGMVQSEDADDEVFSDVDVSKLAVPGLLADSVRSGLLATAADGFLVSAYPVHRSGRSGPSPGWLVFLQPLSAGILEILREVAGVDVELSSTDPAEEPPLGLTVEIAAPEFGIVNGFLPPTRSRHFHPENIDDHFALLEFPSIIGEKKVRLNVDLPRRLFAAADYLDRKIRFYGILGAVIFMVLALVVFEVLVLRRIIALDTDLQNVAHNRSDSLRVREIGNDEIARVAASANEMLATLEHEHEITVAEHDLLISVLDSVAESVLALRPIREANGAVIDYSIVTANREAERSLGGRCAESTGERLSHIFPNLKEQPCFRDYNQVLRSGSRVESEFQIPSSGAWIRHSATPWGDGVVSCFEDISARKQSEDALAETLDQLTRLNAAMMGREDRVLELKSEVNRLALQLGKPKPYESAD